MKILYICHNLATFILNEIIELKERGHDILILAEGTSRIHQAINQPLLIKNGLDKSFFEFSKITTRQQKYRIFLSKLLYDFLTHPIYAVKACLYIIKNYPSFKYGIVDYLDVRQFFHTGIQLIHSPFSIPSIIDKVSLLSHILSIPYTLSFKAHDIWQGNHLSESRKKTKKIKDASRIFTIAVFNKKYLEEQLNMRDKIDVIHDALDIEFLKPTNAKRVENSIIAVSRLHPEKGLIYLIKACHILNQRNVAYTCTIIGDGPEKGVYEKLIDELNVPNIFFTGYLSYDQVKQQLQFPAVFVLPSIIDGDGLGDVLPNGVKEAMAMQVPVVTSDMRGIGELVVDGVSGILVPPGNPQSIADAIERIISQSDLGRKMGEEGRRKIQQDFNIKTEVGKIEKIFIEAIGQKNGELLE